MNRAKSFGLTRRDKLEFPNCSAKNCLNINQGLCYVYSEEVLMEPGNKELRIPQFCGRRGGGMTEGPSSTLEANALNFATCK